MRVGFPVVIRPSYVLGGRAMRIVHEPGELAQFIGEAARLSDLGPILIDGYLEDAIEVDVDVVADGESVFVAGIMEHIEEAGIHSGDSACSLPPHSLAEPVLAEIRRQAHALARALEVRGLMNVQMAIKEGEVFILEVNPRASRTVPFVAKAIGWPIAKVAARVMAGERLADFEPPTKALRHVAVKEAVFPVRPLPRRRSAARPGDEVDRRGDGARPRFRRAPSPSRSSASATCCRVEGMVFISVRDRDKAAMVELGRTLVGARLRADRHRAAPERRCSTAGLQVELINKVHQGRPHIVDRIKDGGIALVLNTTEGAAGDSRQLFACVGPLWSIRCRTTRPWLGRVPWSRRSWRRVRMSLRSRRCNPIIN